MSVSHVSGGLTMIYTELFLNTRPCGVLCGTILLNYLYTDYTANFP